MVGTSIAATFLLDSSTSEVYIIKWQQYSSVSIIRMVTTREHAASLKRPGTHVGFWWDSQKERNQ
jgi:hypothetical protein